MEIQWTKKSQDDLERLYEFASQYNRHHADDMLDRILSGISNLAEHPRMGANQIKYEPREVRKVLFDVYEVHYEIQHQTIYIIDLWHTREDR